MPLPIIKITKSFSHHFPSIQSRLYRTSSRQTRISNLRLSSARLSLPSPPSFLQVLHLNIASFPLITVQSRSSLATYIYIHTYIRVYILCPSRKRIDRGGIGMPRGVARASPRWLARLQIALISFTRRPKRRGKRRMGVHRDGIKRKCLLSTRNRLTTESFHPSPSFSLSSPRRFFFLSLSLSVFAFLSYF